MTLTQVPISSYSIQKNYPCEKYSSQLMSINLNFHDITYINILLGKRFPINFDIHMISDDFNSIHFETLNDQNIFTRNYGYHTSRMSITMMILEIISSILCLSFLLKSSSIQIYILNIIFHLRETTFIVLIHEIWYFQSWNVHVKFCGLSFSRILFDSV